MALTDILTDVFTGRPATEAAQQQRDFFNQLSGTVNNQITSAQAGGLDALQGGQTNAINRLDTAQTGALSALDQGFGTGRTDLLAGIDNANKSLYGWLDPAADIMGTYGNAAREELQGTIQPSVNAFDQMLSNVQDLYRPVSEAGATFGNRATLASNMSEDALGLNGPEGVARAQAAFRAGPGYDFAVDQGLNAISRGANAAGMVASGNQLRESQTFGQGLADQEFHRWEDDLAGREKLYAPLSAATLEDAARGVSGAQQARATGVANILTGTGSRIADLLSTTGRAASDQAAGGARSSADIYTKTGSALADLVSRGGAANADVITGLGKAGADVFSTGGKNIAELLSNLAKTQIGFEGQLIGPTANSFALDAAGQLAGSNNFVNLLGSGVKFLAGGGLGALGSAIGSLLS
jgi:hypothetical protein